MYLKRLEVQGFKTFASRTVFEFKPGTTAVVGPNGSGKSNVADAVRWVLGEQSYAALRCKRTEDLIYSGGAKRAPAGLAEAILTIDNTDRVLPLAFDEVTITRRATRAGENEYLINRSRARLRDVQELAAALGGSYTIIGQGMVDAALALRSEERRRLFEEAAGLGGFEARQQEAERRLRETDANIERVADLLAELEPQLRSLKRQAGQARAHRDLADELRAMLAQSYRFQWQAVQSALVEAEQRAAEAAQVLDAQRARYDALLSEARELRAGLQDARIQLSELHRQRAELHRQAEADQRDLAIGAERRAALDLRRTDAERALGDLTTRCSEAEQELARCAAAAEAAAQELAQQRVALRSAEQSGGGHEAALRAARRAADDAQRMLLSASGTLAASTSRIEQLQSRVAVLARDEEAAAERDLQLQQALDAARRVHSEAEQALANDEAAVVEALRAQQDAGTALDELRHRRAESEEALGVARRTLADLEARFESLDRLRRSHSGAFAGVRAALEWAERVVRPGFALVSSLLATPAELETAIEVALGSRLQNIVVEHWQDAEDAIKQLKSSGAGRATFLPLDSLRPPRTLPAPTGAGVLGVAAELVGYDPHYAKVVAQLLGRVLIVEDLPAARRVLHGLDGGWTLVTLGGEQVTSGGAVTGGSQTRDTGTLRRERELRELPDQIDNQRRQVDAHTTARAAFVSELGAQEQRLRELRNSLREHEERRNKRRDALAQASRRSEQAARELEWHRSRAAERGREAVTLAQQEAALFTEQQQAREREAEARRLLEEARTRFEAVQAADAERKAHIGVLQAAIAGAESTARSARTRYETQRQAVARLQAQVSEAQRRYDQSIEERMALDARLEQAAQRHDALLTQIAALQDQALPVEASIAEAEATSATLAEQEHAAVAALRDLEAASGRTQLEAERASDRVSLVWERAAADDLDVEQLAAEPLPSQPLVPDSEERIAQLRQRIQRLGPVNPLALDEYEAANERHSFLSNQINDLRQAAATLRALISELQVTMDARFAQTFEAVAREFELTFSQLFGGGAARLTLVREGEDEDHAHHNGNGTRPASSKILGVDILARPPGKRQQPLSLLSGGERSLTAVALLFAILRVNPTPFCFLDEVDAALDESNVGRFREALTSLTDRTQFVVITHNRGTLEAAGTLYGITMNDDGSSKILSLRLEEVMLES